MLLAHFIHEIIPPQMRFPGWSGVVISAVKLKSLSHFVNNEANHGVNDSKLGPQIIRDAFQKSLA